MKTKSVNHKVSIIIKTVIYIFLLSGCIERKDIEIPISTLKDGDIVFRRGTGITSQVVLGADSKGVYSHIGIIKFIDNECCVIHSVPEEPDFEGDIDRVKIESINSFFSWKKASSGAIMRVKDIPEIAAKASEHAYFLFTQNVLFDHDYNIKDTTKMYCTELVDFVYKKEGVDLSEGRLNRINIPGFNGEYLFPSDIISNDKLYIIYKY